MKTTLQKESKSQQDVATALLQTIDPLIDKLKIIVADYVLSLRRQLLAGETFLTVRQAARISGISVPTLYVWIDKGILNPITLEDKIYVSTSEVQFAREHIYQQGKATKKAGGKQMIAYDKEPVLAYKVKNGLPDFSHLKDEGNSTKAPPEEEGLIS